MQCREYVRAEQRESRVEREQCRDRAVQSRARECVRALVRAERERELSREQSRAERESFRAVQRHSRAESVCVCE